MNKKARITLFFIAGAILTVLIVLGICLMIPKTVGAEPAGDPNNPECWLPDAWCGCPPELGGAGLINYDCYYDPETSNCEGQCYYMDVIYDNMFTTPCNNYWWPH